MANTEIKALPTPGYLYKIQSNDTLRAIAGHAYKDESKWQLLARENAGNLASYKMSNEQLRRRGRDYVGHPENLIMPGEIIIIPELVTPPQPAAPQPADPENVTPPDPPAAVTPRVVSNQDLIFFNRPKFPKGSVVFGMQINVPAQYGDIEWYVPYQGRFVYGVDILARAWSGTFLWNPKESKGYDLQRKAVVTNHFNDAIKSMSFTRSCIVIDGEVMGTGFIGGRKYKITPNDSSVECRYHSKTQHLIDSDTPSALIDPLTQPNKTVADIIKDTLDCAGYGLIDYVKDTRVFQITPQPGKGSQKYGAFIQGVAAKYGLFLMDDQWGNVVIHKIANKASVTRPLCHLEFGNQTAGSRFGQFATEWEADYDDLGFYNTYNVYDSVRQSKDKIGQKVSTDVMTPTMGGKPLAPPPRYLYIENNGFPPDLKNIVMWTITKTWMDAREFRVPVGTWYNEHGKLWRAGDLVDIISPVTEKDNTPMRCVIREIEFEWAGDSRRCILTVCPVFALTDKGNLSDLSHRGFML